LRRGSARWPPPRRLSPPRVPAGRGSPSMWPRAELWRGPAAGLATLSLPGPVLGAVDRQRVLVVIQLAGGNDGLNTVVPLADPRYRAARPSVALASGEVLPLANGQLGFHASMAKLHALFEQGQGAAIQGVGFPRPDRSHFESTAIWQTARLEPYRDPSAWR